MNCCQKVLNIKTQLQNFHWIHRNQSVSCFSIQFGKDLMRRCLLLQLNTPVPTVDTHTLSWKTQSEFSDTHIVLICPERLQGQCSFMWKVGWGEQQTLPLIKEVAGHWVVHQRRERVKCECTLSSFGFKHSAENGVFSRRGANVADGPRRVTRTPRRQRGVRSKSSAQTKIGKHTLCTHSRTHTH